MRYMRYLGLGTLLLIVLGHVWPVDVSAATFAYISNRDSDTVGTLNLASKEWILVPVGNEPYGVAVSPDGTRVYVTNQADDTVSVIDTSINTVIATVSVGDLPQGVAVNPTGTRIYVANRTSHTVSVIDAATNSVIATIPMGPLAAGPEGVAVNPTGTRVYVANSSGSVLVIDTATNSVIANIKVGCPHGMAVTPDGTRIYTTSLCTINGVPQPVAVIDAATNTVIATVDVGATDGVAVTPDGARVYVATTLVHTVSVIDTVTHTVIATVSVGFFPSGLAVTPDGARVYVANVNSNSLSVIDTTTNAVIDTIATVGIGPIAFGEFIGPRLPSVAGAVAGVSPRRVICRNLTTGQRIAITIPSGARSWSCTASGLVVNPGDRVRQQVTGTVD